MQVFSYFLYNLICIFHKNCSIFAHYLCQSQPRRQVGVWSCVLCDVRRTRNNVRAADIRYRAYRSPWVKMKYVKDHLQFVCGELHSAPMSRSTMLRQSLCRGQHIKNIRKEDVACPLFAGNASNGHFVCCLKSASRRRKSIQEPVLSEI